MTDLNVYPLKVEPDLERHIGLIFAEEDALKQHLSGITVPNPTNGTNDKVGVWFRYPEGERQIKYPFITIDLLSVEPNYDLWTSDYFQKPEGLYVPSYSTHLEDPPEGWAKQSYSVRQYLSFRLLWQVSHFARNALQDRYLTAIFATDVFPARPFWITVPADNVYRRTEVVQMTTADSPETTESGTKRIFRKIYTISMLAEVPQDILVGPNAAVAWRSLRVLIPVVALDQFDNYFREILDGHEDPIEEFTREERAAEGEYLHISQEGHSVPTPP